MKSKSILLNCFFNLILKQLRKKKVRVFWPFGKPSLIIEDKAEAYQSGAPFNSLEAGNRPHPYMQGKLEKMLTGTNALAYRAAASVTNKK
jgi:hypothetical protein